MVATASWVVLVRMIQSFGSAATAGYTIAIRIIYFSILPSWGLGSAAATLVGQNLGAKHPARAEQSVWRASFFNMIFLGALSIVFLLFAPQLIGIFSRDAAVIAIGASCLRIISACYVLFAYGMVIVQAFNGATTTVRSIGILFQLYILWRGRGRIQILGNLSHRKPARRRVDLRVSPGKVEEEGGVKAATAGGFLVRRPRPCPKMVRQVRQDRRWPANLFHPSFPGRDKNIS